MTFTRKAAGQLLRRVRSRLARLAGVGLGAPAPSATRSSSPRRAGVSTYHAFAGSLLRDYGLLLPVEPDTRLLSETELWQLAFDVVNEYPGRTAAPTRPRPPSPRWCCGCGDSWPNTSSTPASCATPTSSWSGSCTRLPAGPYQRERGPSQWLLRLLGTQTERTELVPLLDALHERMRAEKVMDFGMQMASAARLAATFPQVGEQLRGRYRVVLLDEYQDTGHAQRIALSSLFGGGVDDELALTAVGDPIQSIYGWRGASATNLPRFTTDFPRSDGTPAPTLELRTSWRNPPRALHLANAVSAEARRRSVAVRALRPRPDAQPGTRPLRTADRREGRTRLGRRPPRRGATTGPSDGVSRRRRPRCWCAATPTPRRSPMRCAPAASPSRSSGWPGLLSVPEVAEVVAMLRLVADPAAGAAAMRVLTGCALAARRPRHRRALAAGACARGARAAGAPTSALSIASAADPARVDADTVCLADAIADPGPAGSYSAAGYQRITALAAELGALRAHLGHPLAELVAEVRRVLGVDCEVRAAAGVEAGWAGTEHLDAFADVVAGYAEHADGAATPLDASATTSVAGLLAFLDVAETIENGLAPAPLAVANDRVQVLTVHAAKGLEWQVVAVAHLTGGTFPSTASKSTWLTDAAELPPLLRGDRAAAGALGVPVLDTSDVTNRKQLSDKISEHRRQLDQRRVDEERRLLYVAITRAEDTLLAVRAPLGSHRDQAAWPVGFPGARLKDIIDRFGRGRRPVR